MKYVSDLLVSVSKSFVKCAQLFALALVAVAVTCGVASATDPAVGTITPSVGNFDDWVTAYIAALMAGLMLILAPKLGLRVLNKMISFFFKSGNRVRQ